VYAYLQGAGLWSSFVTGDRRHSRTVFTEFLRIRESTTSRIEKLEAELKLATVLYSLPFTSREQPS
jgi:hypothetical protein